MEQILEWRELGRSRFLNVRLLVRSYGCTTMESLSTHLGDFDPMCRFRVLVNFREVEIEKAKPYIV